MSRIIYRLCCKPHPSRQNACEAIQQAPDGHIVTISEPTRTSDQNRLLWPLLGDISRQVLWPNIKMEMITLSSEQWKHMFTAALDAELAVVPNLDGTGFIALGKATSTMSKRKFSELIEFIYSFGASKGVKWSEPQEASDAAR